MIYIDYFLQVRYNEIVIEKGIFKFMKYGHKISEVKPGSIGDELEIRPGDRLLSINGQKIEDVFDYHYYVNDDFLTLLVEKADGEEWNPVSALE